MISIFSVVLKLIHQSAGKKTLSTLGENKTFMSLSYSFHKQQNNNNNNNNNTPSTSKNNTNQSSSFQNDNSSNNNSSRVFIPRDWRDHLARAINERDLARIEHLIEFGLQNNHTKFNDPLVADAAFLLQMAQENAMKRFQVDAMSNSSLHHHHNNNNMNSGDDNTIPNRHTPKRGFQNRTSRATKSKLVDDGKGGGMSWVAPPLVSLVAGPLDRSNNNNNNSNSSSAYHQQSVYGSRSVSALFRDSNPLGNTASLREKVSQLREMALFPDATVSQMYDSPNDQNYSSAGSATTSSFFNLKNHTHNSTAMSLNGGGATTALINRHRMIFSGSAYSNSSSITEDAAAAMGVPSLWIDRPIGLNWDPVTDGKNKMNNNDDGNNSPNSHNLKKKTHYPYSGETGESMNTSPIRSVFEDPSITGAALRLHSFVHAEEEPAIKSSRLYQAYVAMERLAPKENPNINNNNNHNKFGVDVSVSPVRESSINNHHSPSSNSNVNYKNNNSAESEMASIYSSSSSPEHVRFIRKLTHEASAPAGAEVSRLLRFLSATESMNRGALEQEAEGMLRSGVANYRYGLLHSRGISSDRAVHDHQNQVFLNN